MDMSTKGLISWFTRNPVAANLVMILIFFSGALSLANISKEMFPRTENRMISIKSFFIFLRCFLFSIRKYNK